MITSTLPAAALMAEVQNHASANLRFIDSRLPLPGARPVNPVQLAAPSLDDCGNNWSEDAVTERAWSEDEVIQLCHRNVPMFLIDSLPGIDH